MRDYVHEHFAKHKAGAVDGYSYAVRESIICKDGIIYSIQASDSHYCMPKENDAEHYSHVEVATYTERRATYENFVPVAVINKRIHRHGGPVNS